MAPQGDAGRITQLQYLLLSYVNRIIRSSTSNFRESLYGEVRKLVASRSKRPDRRRRDAYTAGYYWQEGLAQPEGHYGIGPARSEGRGLDGAKRGPRP